MSIYNIYCVLEHIPCIYIKSHTFKYIHTMYTFIFEHTSVKRVPLTLSELNKHEYSNEILFHLWFMPVNNDFVV